MDTFCPVTETKRLVIAILKSIILCNYSSLIENFLIGSNLSWLACPNLLNVFWRLNQVSFSESWKHETFCCIICAKLTKMVI